eukprot:3151353-Amphidinium_carterae.1
MYRVPRAGFSQGRSWLTQALSPREPTLFSVSGTTSCPSEKRIVSHSSHVFDWKSALVKWARSLVIMFKLARVRTGVPPYLRTLAI